MNDPVMTALLAEKSRLEALLNGYKTIKDKIDKIDKCLATIAGAEAPPKWGSERVKSDGWETIKVAVRRILIASGSVGMTAKEIDNELNLSHPVRALSAASQTLSRMHKLGEINHTGMLWSYRFGIDRAAT